MASSSYYVQLVPGTRYVVLMCGVRKTRGQAIAYFADSPLCKKNRSASYACDRTSTPTKGVTRVGHALQHPGAGILVEHGTAGVRVHHTSSMHVLSVRCPLADPFETFSSLRLGNFWPFLRVPPPTAVISVHRSTAVRASRNRSLACFDS